MTLVMRRVVAGLAALMFGATPGILTACLAMCAPMAASASPVDHATHAAPRVGAAHDHHGTAAVAVAPEVPSLDSACQACCADGDTPAAVAASRAPVERPGLLAAPSAMPIASFAGRVERRALERPVPAVPRPPAPTVAPLVLRI